MAKYMKKPVVIEAWQWLGTTLEDARIFCTAKNIPHFCVGGMGGKAGLIIPTLKGNHLAQKGDWIIKGVQGEFYPIKNNIFLETYEKVVD
jgi:hypothetical protein